MTTPQAKAARDAALGFVEAAQRLLYQAAAVSCDLQGWADQWDAIGKYADATKALWHKLNDAPLPTGHDGEKPKRPRRCLDENPRTTDR